MGRMKDDFSATPVKRHGAQADLQTAQMVTEGPFVLIAGDAPDELQELAWLTNDCGFIALRNTNAQGSAGMAQRGLDVVLVNFATVAAASFRRVEALREEHGKPVVCVLPYPNQQEVAQVARLAADDLLFKPLRTEELASRLRLVLQKISPESTCGIVDRRRRGRRKEDRVAVPNPERRHDSFLQINERRKTVSCRGRELRLSPKEYQLLSLFASDPGRVFSKQEIVAQLWPTKPRASASDVQQYVRLLRKKIEPDPSNPRLIQTVPSFGYRLMHPDEM